MPPSPHAGPPSPPRVLIVEDHDRMRARIHEVLEVEFAVVGEAADGEEALVQIHELRPDVVVLDIDLPGLGGFTVTSRIAGKGDAPAVVFLSVHRREDYAREGAARGALAYVEKGDLHRELCDAVRTAASGRPFP